MRSRPASALLLMVIALSSCRQIIGIEEATQEAPLASAGASGAGGGMVPAAGGSMANVPTAGTPPDVARGGAAGEGALGSVGASGGTTNAEAGAGADGGAGAPPAEPTLCEQYCDAVMENCSGNLAVYTSREMCLAVCAVLPPGEPGDGEKHAGSVHCRLEAAQAAAISEPEYSCPIAAPGGSGECGSNCENLCLLRQTVCSAYLSGSSEDCLSECAKLEDLGGYTVSSEAVPLHTRGGHVQCRLYHVSAAATDEPDTHCLHADGATPCISR